MRRLLAGCLLLGLSALAGNTWATETENLGIQAVPAPGKVVIDGKFNDWDLSGGIFACGDVENGRDKMAVWFHTMYDQENLYILTRWIDDTPMNNPGVTSGDMGFQGDCLQVRIIAATGTANEKTAHMTAWRGRDAKDVIDLVFGRDFNGGNIKDGKTQGCQQVFGKSADGKGYVQEIALPWKLLTKDGQAPQMGAPMQMALEPNFTIGSNGRMSYKDIFKAGISLDRVFTFMSSNQWGDATLLGKGPVPMRPVRLSDGREFAIKMENGLPSVNWTGLIKSRELLGFKAIKLMMPQDGYVSVIIKNSDGVVVRQLLNAEFLTKGDHEVKWDGLTSPNWRNPGEPVSRGSYTWSAIYHTGIGLQLKGFACNGGITPWDYPAGKGNWGGDHGAPSAVATDGQKVYLGWNGAEAGKALVACDLEGLSQWNNTHGGIGGASNLAVDNGTVYANNDGVLYRVESAGGTYTPWEGTDSTDLPLKGLLGDIKTPGNRISMTAGRGKLYVASKLGNVVAVADGKTGKLLKKLDVAAPMSLSFGADGHLYAISAGTTVLRFDENDQPKSVVSTLQNACAVAADKQGQIYVGVQDPDNQVKVFSADGKPAMTIGRQGGRALLGSWTPDGMRFINDIAIDAQGKLWVMETDASPKRVSAWDTKTGKLYKEFFGATAYGALGGAINPSDPSLMVGQGCEWKLDSKTGRAACLGVITRDNMSVTHLFKGSNGKVYLIAAEGWAYDVMPVRIYERIGNADYKLRASFKYEGKPGEGGGAKTTLWADENGDGAEQPNELATAAGHVRFSGWYMNMAPDLTIYAGNRQFKVAGFTSCNAPKYDLTKPVQMPAAGFGSADGRFILTTGEYGTDHSWMVCYDTATGKETWRYADTFVGVHGSHNAPPPEVGLVRGSYGPCGSIKLPAPIGNVWVIPTNVGEWHMVSEQGYYITGLFQGDPLKISWPEQAVPGASMDNCPPGMGGEDFGGSVTLADDGKTYLQTGKTAFWNVQVTGLDTVKPISGTAVTITADDVKMAQGFREQYLQVANAGRMMVVKKGTPKFSGNIEQDFGGMQLISFKKLDDAAARAAAAWDDQNLYLAWDVKDNTPWANGSSEVEMMYLHGDTVDFQLGTDSKADKNRGEGVMGDLRLSIGNFKGQPTAVIYRKVATEKHPKTFSSGVVKEYLMDSVTTSKAVIKVTKQGKGYVVEASIPLAELGLQPAEGLSLRGDFGVTHGDTAGERTRLRSYWANQHTGIVDDAVFELQMEPKNWGTLQFKN